ncbi:hypothetical protein WA1_49905 [Scytonema hofmannii PCC 7110]|uniref:Uncharacterized protein n=1 Tax=Scytonema hofmannii PCC 7110 TaxID=128403 RepID=A0A139WQY8_9CYAN|nr:hypothetical protein [Scytonema hofmannii]KYC34847.1 hypothetical protein WA1_49905 [Scytonema hofmannii PCC 7110]
MLDETIFQIIFNWMETRYERQSRRCDSAPEASRSVSGFGTESATVTFAGCNRRTQDLIQFLLACCRSPKRAA